MSAVNAAREGRSNFLLCALIQNNASEVGMAILSEAKGEIALKQLVDTSRSYRLLTSELAAVGPDRVLLCDTRVEQGLNLAVREAAAQWQCTCQLVKRSQFDDTKGQQLLQHHSPSDAQTVKATNYLAIGAAGKPRS